MAQITAPSSWLEHDTQRLARNWTQDQSGAQREKGNEASSISALAQSFNYAAARLPKVHFSKLILSGNVATDSLDPIFRWIRPDLFDNSRSYTVRLVTGPKLLGSNLDDYAYAGRWSGANSEQSIGHNSYINTAENAYLDCWTDQYRSTVANASGAFVEDGITTSANYRIHSVVVQEDELGSLDDTVHLAAHSYASRGAPVLADALEELRNVVHRLRTTHLQRAAQWSAIGTGSIVISSGASGSNRRNLFDENIGARSATSPGAVFCGHRCGVGREDSLYGQKVPIYCTVLAATNATAGVNVCFEGPTHCTPNALNALVINSDLRWYNAVGYVYGNPQAHENTVSTLRNKIDIFVENIGVSSWVNIYAISAWINDPMSVL